MPFFFSPAIASSHAAFSFKFKIGGCRILGFPAYTPIRSVYLLPGVLAPRRTQAGFCVEAVPLLFCGTRAIAIFGVDLFSLFSFSF